MTTPKPIPDLSTEELRIEIALADGWVQVPPENFKTVTWPVYEKDGRRASLMTDSLPNYPADANAALTLAHALAEKGWQFSCVRHRESGTWSITFEVDEETHHSEIDAPTFPLALCRAYLAVIRRESKP